MFLRVSVNRVAVLSCDNLGVTYWQVRWKGAWSKTAANLSPVYTIQYVFKPVVEPVWQPVECLYTRYNRLSNRLYNRLTTDWTNSGSSFNTFVHPVCQTGCTTRCDNRGLTTSCIVYTNIQPVWKHVVSCKRGLSSQPFCSMHPFTVPVSMSLRDCRNSEQPHGSHSLANTLFFWLIML